MVDYQRQLLDELMGRNRNLSPSAALKHEKTWQDAENCRFFLHSFCPHDLFVNTRADLGPCGKLHCEEARKQYLESKSSKKLDIEHEFIRFCSNMINEVDRKIVKGRQRLDLMNSKLEMRPVSKHLEQINNLNEKVQKLLREAEEAGNRGDVDQAQMLMETCDKLKDDKDSLSRQYGFASVPDHQEKQMEVCETCGAFLIVGDAQSRIDDHLMGKQHIGYSRLRKALEDYRLSQKSEERRSSSHSRSSKRSDDRSRYNDRDERHRRDDRRHRREPERRDRNDSRRDDRDRRDKNRHRNERDRRSRSRSSS